MGNSAFQFQFDPPIPNTSDDTVTLNFDLSRGRYGELAWKTMGGNFVTMTPSLAYDIFAAASMQDQALHAYGEHLIHLINEADDPSDVDIHSGWPETFQ